MVLLLTNLIKGNLLPGQVYNNDSEHYLTLDYTKTTAINQQQYDAIKSFADNPYSYGFEHGYDGIINSCIDFTWEAMNHGGLNPMGFEGNYWPTWNITAADSLIDGFLGDIFGAISTLVDGESWQTHISELVDDLFNAAAKFVQPRRDPLTLDLDGDGLETVGTAAGILFDHDGDGIKNGSGWVSADDGFLVLDKNGNGTIDNGHELFGDAFVKANGQLAADGFDALASLDGNGKVDASDAQFGNLKVWQDLNQDGLSQAGELFTLAQLGIASINVTSTDHSQTLPNGNQIADLGTYTKTDGSLGTTGEVIGDINLATDTFHRQFPDHLDTSAVAHLPDMQGSGAVRDLREAANDCRWRMAA
ncbi:MAG: hypothetical protein HOP36_09915 [Methyloglobulus sp.]|nr:hypothetical protein [Methyloglobulus sp.]